MPVIHYEGVNTVTYTGRNRLKPGTGEVIDPVTFTFTPGPNDVPDDVWDLLRKQSEECQARYEDGTLADIKVQGENGKVEPLPSLRQTNISKIVTADAIKLVRSVRNLELLEMFQKQEGKRKPASRRPVVAAIAEQIKDVQTPEDKPDTAIKPLPGVRAAPNSELARVLR